MSKTVLGLFDRMEDAQAVVRDLVDAGFRRNDISLVANDATGTYAREFTRHDATTDKGDAAATGAGAGAVLGGIGGLLVGLGVLAIPGIGPVLAAGPLIAGLAGAGVGAAAGAVAGGLLGALVDAGVPEAQANNYVEGVRRGGTLVSVSASDDMASRAADIMNRFHPIDVDRRALEWGSLGQAGAGMGREPSRAGGEIGRINNQASSTWDTDTSRNRQEVGRVNTDPSELEGEHRNTDYEVGVINNEAGAAAGGDLPPEHQEIGVVNNDLEGTGFDEYDVYFRRHFSSSYPGTTYTYEQYRPYYAYGYDLANDPRYQGRSWNQIEMEARRDWERDHPGTLWDDFKDAVHEGWLRVTGRV